MFPGIVIIEFAKSQEMSLGLELFDFAEAVAFWANLSVNC